MENGVPQHNSINIKIFLNVLSFPFVANKSFHICIHSICVTLRYFNVQPTKDKHPSSELIMEYVEDPKIPIFVLVLGEDGMSSFSAVLRVKFEHTGNK